MRFIPLELVFRDGSTALRAPRMRPTTISKGEDVTYYMTCINENGEARDITGHTFAAGIMSPSTGAEVVNRLGSIDSAEGGIAIVVINDGDTVDVAPDAYVLSVYVNDGTNDWQPLPLSPVYIVQSASLPGASATPPGPAMLLIGVPVPTQEDIDNQRVLSPTVLDPTTLEWVNRGVENAVGAGAIPAGALIKASATVGRYALWLRTDSPLLIVGAAVTACSGVGATFTAQFSSGTVATLLSDGAATIAAGAPVVASGATDGRVKAGLVSDEGFLGFNVGALVAASVDAHVSVR